MLRRVFDRWEPPLGDLEGDYRRHFLARDIGEARAAGWLGITVILLFVAPDFYFFGWGPMFAGLLLLRVAHVALAMTLIGRLRQARRPEAVDRLVLINELNLIVAATAIYGTRPPEVWLGHVFGVLMIVAFYALVPQPLAYRVAAGGLFAAAMVGVVLATRTNLTQVERVGTIVGLAGANLLGVLVSVRLNNYRRDQYRALVEEQRARQVLEHLATTDSLTGVLNRRSFIEAAESEVQRFRRYGRPFAVIVVDLDHFKHINDTHGHLAGDRALLGFTALVRRTQRTTDLFGRLGGEEFGLLLPETTLADAAAVAERLRADCAANTIVVEEARIQVTLSAGVVAVGREDVSLDNVMRRADKALYRAKEGGRNRVEVAVERVMAEGERQ